MELSELKELIRNSFEDVPRPDSVSGSEPAIGEREEVAVYFSGRDWRDLALRDLEGWGIALDYFSPTSFRYFLPAFLLASLDDVRHTTDLCERTVWSFSEPKDYWMETFERRLETFTNLQLRTCLEFIRYVQQRNGMDFYSEERYLSSRLEQRGTG